MRQPKVLVLDIETAPIIAAIWDLKINGYVPVNQIVTDRYVLAWGAKWLGQKKMRYMDQRGQGAGNDKHLLMQLWPLLDAADIVVSYNGEAFDVKRIVSRFMIHGIKPPSPFRNYDVMKLHKRVADHTSNTLDYVSSRINTTYKKLHHSDYPGFELWRATALEDKPAGWKAMKKYNIHDVLSTEENTIKTLAFAPDSFPDFYPVADNATGCARCGFHGYMQVVNPRLAKVYFYTQYRCPSCGSFQTTGKKVN